MLIIQLIVVFLVNMKKRNDLKVRIIIMGPPGVGKGTEASMLEKQLNIPHVSTGDIFRALFRTDDPIGVKAREYMDQGLFVPDDVTNEVVKTRFREDDVKKSFLFDGYPRNTVQASAFDKFLAENGWEIDIVLNIDAADEVIINRLTGRRICPKCGEVYHIESNPPKVAGKCDKDGTELIQREDDMPETVKKRIDIYHEQTKPLIDYYSQKGLLVNIDGSKTIKNTHAETMSALKPFLNQGELK